MLENPVLYRPSTPVAGWRPWFVLQNDAMRAYFRKCVGGLPEAPLIDWVNEWLKPGSTVLDIGAHVGTWALPLACLHTVVAWEPNPEINELLWMGKCLMSPRSDLHLRVEGFALSDEKSRSVRLYVPSRDGGGVTIVQPCTTGFHHTVNVAQARLDDYAVAPDLIKIDVEGAELKVLRGGVRTIRRSQPKIIFECWPENVEDTLRFLRDELSYNVVPVAWLDTYLAEPT